MARWPIIWVYLLICGSIYNVAGDSCAYPGPPDIDLFLPHNKYCNLFYRLDKCPNNLVYNPEKQQCDSPSNKVCGSKQILTPGIIQGGGGNQQNSSYTTGKPGNEGGFSFIGGSCPSKKACPRQDNSNQKIFIPHSTSCNLFCSCVRGTPLLYKCGKGLHFNPRTSICENPSDAGCSGENDVTPVTVFPPILEIEVWRRPVLVEGECYPKGKCPQHGDVLLPHTTACNLLCGCKDGTSSLYICPRGLHFNADSKYCDFPINAGCNSNMPAEAVTQPTSPKPKPVKPTKIIHLGGYCLNSKICPNNIPSGSIEFVPHLTVCNLFCGCDSNYKSELYACPKGLHFNPETQVCDLPNNAGCNPIPPQEINPVLQPNSTGNGNCPTIQECPKNDPSDFTIYLPHVTDCGLFCRCEHGTAKLDKCARGLHFNPKKQACDVPNDASCITTTAVGENANPTSRPGQEGNNNNNSGTGSTEDGTSSGGTGDERQELCPAEGTCLPGKTNNLPHQRSCELFCECVSGTPRLRQCPGGLHFNPKNKKCEAPNVALCQGECGKLEHRDATHWFPETCTSGLSKIGDVCKIKCAKQYELRGSTVVTCTKHGWNGTAGLTIMPSCKAPEEVGKDIIDNVKEQAKDRNFLFLLDESLSLTEQEFDSEISFLKAIVSQFPLSRNRTAGVITFSGSAAVDIHMTQTDSCKFFEATDNILYAGGSTDILLALKYAIQETATYSSETSTIIFLITDGKSETNPTNAAKDLKKKGHILFTIGVGEYDRKQLEPLASPGNDGVPLFFGLSNFKAFNKIAEYLHTVHGYGANLNCFIPNIVV